MPSPTRERDVADRGLGKAVVAAHDEAVVFVDVDARDVDVRDRRDLVAHRVQHRLERTIVGRELDQAQDAVDAAITAVVDVNDRASCHGTSVTCFVFRRRFVLRTRMSMTTGDAHAARGLPDSAHPPVRGILARIAGLREKGDFKGALAETERAWDDLVGQPRELLDVVD